jgi:hypothetical protein
MSVHSDPCFRRHSSLTSFLANTEGATLQIHASNPLELTSSGSVLWRLPLQPWLMLPERIKFNGHEMTRKDEFHITVLDQALAKRHLQSSDLRRRWFQSWTTLDHQITVTDMLWMLQKSEQSSADHSLVTDCVAVALQEARRLLSLWVKKPLPPPVAHITLYTKGNSHGIAIANEQVLRERRIASGTWSAFGLSFPTD